MLLRFTSWARRALCAGLLIASVPLFAAPPQGSGGSVALKIIVVSSEREAQEIRARLKKGEDFAALARAHSTDSTAEDGGSMGVVDPASLRRELRDAITGLAPGQVAGPVKISSGYALLEVESGPAADASGKSSAYSAPAGAQQSPNLALAGKGNVRYAQNVGGAPEAETAFSAYAKPDNWGTDLHEACEIRQKSLAQNIDQLEHLLSPENAEQLQKIRPVDQMQMRFALGQLDAYEGKMDKAITQWEADYHTVGSQIPGALSQLQVALGTGYLHKSEMENGIYTAPGDRCIFPPKNKTPFKQTTDSVKAIQYFEKYLAEKPDDFEGRWLLNLAYMTLGKYPEGVPARYLIPAPAFETPPSQVAGVPRFQDVAPEAGINLVSMAGGIIVDDFDNDGLLDIVTSSYDMCEHMHFFHNNGDGTFTDQSEKAGLIDQLGGLNLIQADYDNDGCMDVLVMRGGWQSPMRRSLLKGHCDGTFTDVTQQAGLLEPMAASQTAVWADIDNDGFLDLFVGNEKGPNQLFHNKGDGTFEEIAHSAGMDSSVVTKGVISADYDNDGFPDFYVSNLNGDNLLYHNNHNRTFTEVGKQAGVQQPWVSFPAWFFDYDNDGLPDLFVPSYYMSVDEVVRSYLGMPHNAEGAKLYHNRGDGTFEDVSASAHLDRVWMPMGSNFGDMDNDGFLDIYLGNGNPSYTSMLPHVLLRNVDGKSFADVTAASGTGDLHKGHGVAFADIDRDGDEDLLTVTGGAIPGDAHAFRLFENPGDGNDWINLHLVGVKSNRAAIGARIKLVVQERRRKAADHLSNGLKRRLVRGLSPGTAHRPGDARRMSRRWKSGGPPAIRGRSSRTLP